MRASRVRVIWLVLLGQALFVGCGDQSMPAGAGGMDAMPGTSGMGAGPIPVTGGTGGGAPEPGCPPLEHLFSPRKFDPQSKLQVLIRSLAADETSVYFVEQRAVYRAPATGGEPVVIGQHDEPREEPAYHVWRYKGDLLVVTEGGLESMPVAGGKRTRLVAWKPGLSPPTKELPLAGDLIFQRESAHTDPGSQQFGVFKVDLLNRTASFVPVGPKRVWSVAQASGRFFVGMDDLTVVTDEALSRLYSVPVDGGPTTALLPDAVAYPFIADDAYLYFTGHLGNRKPRQVYRLPLAGGPPELVLEDLARNGTVAWINDAAVSPEGLVIFGTHYFTPTRHREELWHVPRVGKPTMLGCLEKDAIYGAVTLSGNTVYATVTLADKTGGVARFRLP